MKMTNQMALGLLLSASLPCFAAYYWRPSTTGQTWADAVWSTDVSAVGSLAFVVGEDAVFDGAEEAADHTVTLAAAATANTVTFDGAADYTLAGAGVLKSAQLVKKGAGTLTLAGAGLDDGSTVRVEGGTVKLDWTDVDLSTAATRLGKDSVVTVDGGTFDLNMPKGAQNLAGNETTRAVTFKIKGAGVDGKGALVNNNDESNWNCALTRLELLGDATVGGKARYDLRAGAPNSAYDMGTLTGPKDATLTIKTQNNMPFGLSVVGTSVSVGGIAVDGEGSLFQVEDNLTWDVPNGLTLTNGGGLNLRYATLPESVPVKVPAGTTGGIFSSAATGRTQGAVTVEAGATLELRDGANCFLDGALVNDGVVFAKGNGVFMNGAISGAGSFTNAANIRFAGGATSEGPVRLNLGNGIDLGSPDVVGYPQFAAVEGRMGTAGAIYLRAKGGTLGNVWDDFVNSAYATSREMIGYANGLANVTTHLDHVDWTIPFLRLGKAGGAMNLHLMNESQITIAETAPSGTKGYLVMSQDAGGARGATITLDPGTSLTSLSADADGFCMGQWSNATNAHARIVADGATVAVPNGFLRMGKDIPYAEFTAKNGADISMKGLEVRSSRTPTAYANGLAQVHLQSGSTWSIGSLGIKSLMAYFCQPALDFEDGTLRATDDWAANAQGWIQTAFGEHPGSTGHVTFDLGGHAVNFSAAAGGASDVTVTGGGRLDMLPYIQAVPTGKWTIDSGVTANLKGMSGFAGGLELAADANATVEVAGTSACEFGVYTHKSFDAGKALKGPFPMLDTSMVQLHTTWGTGPLQETAFVWAGQFYVPADQAGTWYFAGNYDDNIWLEVDGKETFYNGSWNSVATSSAEIGAGWHDFRVVAYDGTGGQGASTVDATKAWSAAKMALGWSATAPSDAKDPASYNRFAPTTLQMRPRPVPEGTTGLTGVRWQMGKYAFNDDLRKTVDDEVWQEYHYQLYANVDVVTNTLQVINRTDWGNASMSRFSGYFRVDDDKAGLWTFRGRYDDCIALRIDSKPLFKTENWQNEKEATADLSAGWHAFDIRVGDGSGGVGPSGLKDDLGVACGLWAKAPGGQALAFDERNFRLVANSLQLGVEAGAGLGGTTTLNAGATLANDAAEGFCPIYGKLAGPGTLKGAFRMTGGTLVADIDGFTATTPALKEPDQQFLADLGAVELRLAERPRFVRLALGPAYGLTDAAAAAVAVTATFSCADAASLEKRYADKFVAQLVDGQLTILNRIQPLTLYLR